MRRSQFPLAAGLVLVIATSARAQGLPPVPVPPENPLTEEKRVLGKILFWDEQLSSNNTVACGTCHRPEAGGTDLRVARHPGRDLRFGTPDDILGSPGVVRMDADGNPVADPVFGLNPQVTGRTAPSFIGAQWAPELFWDGRASSAFVDPESGTTRIAAGGALESQCLAPILNDVEMAHEARTWSEVRTKLASAPPLALASQLPPDLAAAIAADPTYPDLFAAAYGDGEITAVRIAFAIATYERTLVPDQAPWDAFIAGNPAALTPGQQQGWEFFRTSRCAACHQPPFFTGNGFRNVGLRPVVEDRGRQEVTGSPADRARFKVPSLRNVGLRRDLFHNGRLPDVNAALGFYANPALQFPDNQDPLVAGGIPVPPPVRPALVDFLVNGLTDPRLAAGAFPFDRPRLASEGAGTGVAALAAAAAGVRAEPSPFSAGTVIAWTASRSGRAGISIYDVTGGLVRRLEGDAEAGRRAEIRWDGTDAAGRRVPGGVYFYRLGMSGQEVEGRVVVLR